MRIEVPFTFRATAVLPRRQREETVTLLGREVIDIPEFTGADAPVVAQFKPDTAIPHAGLQGEEVDYRRVGGGLLRPARMKGISPQAGNRVTLRITTTQTIQQDLAAWSDLALQLGPGHQPGLGETLTPWGRDYTHEQILAPIVEEADFVVRRHTGDNREATVARIRRSAEAGSLAFIDGVLHQHTEGPCWVLRPDVQVSHNPLGYGVKVIAAPELGSLLGDSFLRAYGAARYHEMMAVGRELARSKGQQFIGQPSGQCRVFEGMPPQREDHFALVETAFTVIASMASILGKLPTKAIREFADLKDILKVVMAQPNEPAHAALLPLVRSLDAAWAHHAGVGRVGGENNPLRIYDLRGRGDHEVADVPEVTMDDLTAMDQAGRGPGGP